MQTINYITYDAWWDTDKTILPTLTKEFKLNIFVLSPPENKKYPHKELYGSTFFYEGEQRVRDRDPRCFFDAIKIFWKILTRGNRKDDLYWLMPGYNPFLMAFLLIFLPQKHTIITYHDYTPHYYEEKVNLKNLNEWLFARIKRGMCKKFRKFLFFSNLQKRNFDKDYISKCSVVCNMPLKDFGPLRQDSYTGRRFLFFGAIQEYKRLDLYIKAADMLDDCDAEFIIAGRPIINWNELEKIIVNKDRFRCDVHFIDDNKVADYFAESDFLVLPYTDSTQSGPLLIALNYGIPVIATNIPAFSEFITDGENGFLFERGNVEDLKKCFIRALAMNDEQYVNMKITQEKKRAEYIATTDITKALKTLIYDKICN